MTRRRRSQRLTVAVTRLAPFVGALVLTVLLVAPAARSGAQPASSPLEVVGLDARLLPDVRLWVTPPPTLGLLPVPPSAFTVRTSAGPVLPQVRQLPAAELEVVLLVELPERDDGRWFAVQSAVTEFVLGLPAGAQLTVLTVVDRVAVVSGPGPDRAAAVAALGRLVPGRAGAPLSLGAAATGAARLFGPPADRRQHLVIVSSAPGTSASGSAGSSADIGRPESGDRAVTDLVERGGTTQLVRLAPAGPGNASRPAPPPAPLDRAEVIEVARAEQLLGVLDDIVAGIGNQYELRFRLPGVGPQPTVELRFRDVAASVAPVLPIPSAGLSGAAAPGTSLPADPTTPLGSAGTGGATAQGTALPSTAAPAAARTPAPGEGSSGSADPADPADPGQLGGRPPAVGAASDDGASGDGAADDGAVRPALVMAGLALLCVGAFTVSVLRGPTSGNLAVRLPGALLGAAAGVLAGLLIDRGSALPGGAVLAAYLVLLAGILVLRRWRPSLRRSAGARAAPPSLLAATFGPALGPGNWFQAIEGSEAPSEAPTEGWSARTTAPTGDGPARTTAPTEDGSTRTTASTEGRSPRTMSPPADSVVAVGVPPPESTVGMTDAREADAREQVVPPAAADTSTVVEQAESAEADRRERQLAGQLAGGRSGPAAGELGDLGATLSAGSHASAPSAPTAWWAEPVGSGSPAGQGPDGDERTDDPERAHGRQGQERPRSSAGQRLADRDELRPSGPPGDRPAGRLPGPTGWRRRRKVPPG